MVLTKSDLADADLIELVRLEVDEFVRGSFLENAPVIAVSSTTGAGIAASVLPQLFTSGVGLSNVNDRLIRIYGEHARLQIDSAPGQGTTVSFVIPNQ